jgi:hypothetical protein
MNWENNYYLLLFVVALCGLAWKGWPKIKSVFYNNIPKKTITLVDNEEHNCFWHTGSYQGKLSLQIAGNFMVTNITDRPVALAKVRLQGIKGRVDSSHLSVKDFSSRFFGQYDIPPQKRTTVAICVFIAPKTQPQSKEPIQLDVIITDQFGNDHCLRKVNFRPSDI